MKKVLKVFAVVALVLIIAAICMLCAFAIITKDAQLDEKKLIKVGQTITLCDENGEEITSAALSGGKSVKVSELQKHTINAFIASEDRTFYKHGGLNYKRMLKALYKNITSKSFKEGASTISQQLVKNTHLSNDKTIKRKLKEIKLTKQLENKYSKDEILEMYLNTIYFGHNCYGLQSAANFYFGKSAEQLDLNESATIVGLLTSPNNYSPFKNPEKCLARRNIVLKSMLDCGYIDQNQYTEVFAKPLTANKNNSAQAYGDYVDAVFDELEDIDLNFYDITDGCKVITHIDKQLQSQIESFEYACDNSVIVRENKTGGVKAYKSTINDAKRQPGSTIKPLACYAPAFEEKLLSPFTKILDEKVNYNGYEPENFDKKYHGYVTVEESLAKSYNIPAVKTLNTLTVSKAEKYLNKMNITLDDDEKNLSLALGGMKYGLTLKELADGYSTFPNGGLYNKSHFIKKIISRDGKEIYSEPKSESRVFSEGVCSLINGTLMTTAKTGTAKALKDLKYDVAAKTGTCGNKEGNTDAYAIAYTSEHTVCCWLGDKDNKRLNVTGGGDACVKLYETLKFIYAESAPENLEVNAGTKEIKIDIDDYENNNRIILADDNSPEYNVKSVKVLADNLPLEKSTKFTKPTIKTPKIKVSNSTVNIQLCQAKYYSYIVKRSKNGNFEVIYDGKWKSEINDSPQPGYYIYSVTPYYRNGKKTFYGDEIVFPEINLSNSTPSPQVKIPDIADKDWFNM